MAKPYRIEICKRRTRVRRKESWYLRVVAGNGEVVLTGEKLHNKTDARDLAHVLQWAVPEATIVVADG